MTISINEICLSVIILSFIVNIIVQLTKDFIPLPTKLWCIIVSMILMISAVFVIGTYKHINISISVIILSIFGSFIISYISMYGFDTFLEIWEKFKSGGNINGDNK